VKCYYLIVGIAGVAITTYVAMRYSVGLWAAGLIFPPGTLIGQQLAAWRRS
jgi:hypothetical protein